MTGDNGSLIHLASSSFRSPLYQMAQAAGATSLKVSFDPAVNGNVKIAVSPLPGSTDFQAILNENNEAVGGKHNPITDMIEAKVNDTGIYSLRHNPKDFTDIMAKNMDMRKAISILASKGVINGTTPTTFSPDSPINRAEIAALLTRTLSLYEEYEDGGFSDVVWPVWYFGAAGSAKRHNLMGGVSATLFAPLVTIPKDQIVAVSARVLRNEMKYKDPADIDGTLSIFQDADSLAAWSRTDLALATRESLFPRTGDMIFNPNMEMTRGEAALVLYQLFMKIW
jgi:hypothetical protein